MNGGSHQLFSSASLAHQKHTGVGGRHLFGLLQYAAKGHAFPDQPRMTAESSHFLLEVYIFALELVAQTPNLIGAFTDCYFCASASDGAADHFNEKPQAMDDGIGPLPFAMERAETGGSDHLTADVERKRNV